MRFAIVLALVLVVTPASAAPWFWQREATYINNPAVGADGAVALYANFTLVLLGPDGKVRKEHGFGNRAIVTAMAFAPDGDLVAAGYFQKELALGGTRFTAKKDQDGFIARFKRDGSLRWAVHVASDDTLYIQGVTVTADRVAATGWARFGKARLGNLEIPERLGFVALLDAAGTVLAEHHVDLGGEDGLHGVCVAGDGFVVTGRDRRKNEKEGFIRGLAKDGTTRWTTKVDLQAEHVACRADGTAYVATWGQGLPPKGNYSNDLVVHELDRAGKPVREISVITDIADQPLHLSVDAKELVVSSRHSDGKIPLWTRVSRFAVGDGKLVGSDDYKGAESIYMKAAHGPRGLILVGEVTRGAKATIRGKAITGPALFVSVP